MGTGRQSIEDSIHAPGEGEVSEALGAYAEDLVESEVGGSPHGSGELGREDNVAKREGYDSIEDKEAAEAAAIDQAEDEAGRDLNDDEINDIIDDMRKGKDTDEDEDEGEDEDEDDYESSDEDGADEGSSRVFDIEDIVSELGEDSVVRMKINGEDVDIPVSDLADGYSRQSDYTRKTQEVAQERKAIIEEAAEVRDTKNEYLQRLSMADSLLQKIGTPDQINEVRAEFTRVTQEVAQHDVEIHLKTLAAEAGLLTSKIPEWQTDEKVARAEREAMMKYAVADIGFEPEVLNNIDDHRALLVLHKAMKYDALQRQGVLKDAELGRKARKTRSRKNLKPGQPGRGSTASRKAEKAKQARADRARATGRINDGQSRIADLIDDLD